MSCQDPFKNIDAKEATYDTLSNLYKFRGEIRFQPKSKEKPFPSTPDATIFANINTNLDDLDNNSNNLFIKDNIKNNIYQNCAIQANNPWYTTSSDYTKCEIVKDIKLDNKLTYNADKTTINLNLKSTNKLKTAYSPYYSNVNKSYCENRWYDWIITPNYYLGNTYYKDNSKFGENDVYKCFKPCSDDSIPYINGKGENKCIKKKYFGNGIFANKLMFSPIGLINLIGNVALMNEDSTNSAKNKNILYHLYISILDYNIMNNMDDTIYRTNKIYNNIITNNEILKDIKTIYQEFKKSIDNYILKNNNFDNNENQDYKYSTLLTYKHRNFNEDESEMYTLKGLDVAGALIPPILYHTWVLANIFKPLPLTRDEITVQNANNSNFINNLLYNKLHNIFKDENKAIRLKNIFFKAVNICYNNKTNFSINIIDKTKKTFDLYKDKYTIFINTYYNSEDSSGAKGNRINAAITNQENSIFNNEYKYYLEYELNDFKNSLPHASDANKKLVEEKFFDNNIYKYYYSIERLEAPTCEKGYYFDSKVKNCEKIIEKPIINKNAPIEDEIDVFNINEITKILTIFMQIIMVIIILYIIYIFYDIFGETIFTVFNYLYMKFFEIFYTFSTYIYYIFTDIETYEKIKAENDYKLANKQYKNLEASNFKILSYMNEHKIPINQNP
jgi:hypothetical protein